MAKTHASCRATRENLKGSLGSLLKLKKKLGDAQKMQDLGPFLKVIKNENPEDLVQ